MNRPPLVGGGTIGLEIGARTPEEVAVAVAAEIVALSRSAVTRPQSATS